MSSARGLLSLPDEVLLQIFKIADSEHLLGGLSHTCSRVYRLSMDQTLWIAHNSEMYDLMLLRSDEIPCTHREFYFQQRAIDKEVHNALDKLVYEEDLDHAAEHAINKQICDLGSRALPRLRKAQYNMLPRLSLAHSYLAEELIQIIIRKLATSGLRKIAQHVHSNPALFDNKELNKCPQQRTRIQLGHQELNHRQTSHQHHTEQTTNHAARSRPHVLTRQTSRSIIETTIETTMQELGGTPFLTGPQWTSNTTGRSKDIVMVARASKSVPATTTAAGTLECQCELIFWFIKEFAQLYTGENNFEMTNFVYGKGFDRIREAVLSHRRSASPLHTAIEITQLFRLDYNFMLERTCRCAQLTGDAKSWITRYPLAITYVMVARRLGLDAHLYVVHETWPWIVVADQSFKAGYFWIDVDRQFRIRERPLVDNVEHCAGDIGHIRQHVRDTIAQTFSRTFRAFCEQVRSHCFRSDTYGLKCIIAHFFMDVFGDKIIMDCLGFKWPAHMLNHELANSFEYGALLLESCMNEPCKQCLQKPYVLPDPMIRPDSVQYKIGDVYQRRDEAQPGIIVGWRILPSPDKQCGPIVCYMTVSTGSRIVFPEEFMLVKNPTCSQFETMLHSYGRTRLGQYFIHFDSETVELTRAMKRMFPNR